jgi:hypothetical protein
MKPAQLHTNFSIRFLLLLSGVLLFSLLPVETNSDRNHFGDSDHFGNEYLAENDSIPPTDNDSGHSDHIFELVFKQTVEKKELTPGTNSHALLKQGIHHIEVVSAKISSDRSMLHADLKLLSKEHLPGFLYRKSFQFFSTLLSHTGDIAINAP